MRSAKGVSQLDSSGFVSRSPSGTQALLLFHFGAGARLAVRRFAPLAALAMALLLFLRQEFFAVLISGLDFGQGLVWGVFSACAAWISAVAAAPRVQLGLHGWMGHLPATWDTRRRTAIAGMWIALIPVLLGISLLYTLTYMGTGTFRTACLAGSPVLGIAAAQATFPIRAGFFLRPLCFVAGILSVSGNWVLLGICICCLIAVDIVSRPQDKRRRSPAFAGKSRELGLHYFMFFRALRWRQFFYVLSVLPIFGLTYAFLNNNSAAAFQRRSALVFGTGLACVCFVALTANALAARRPAWPWLRSLPGSAKSRIIRDAVFLFASSLPLLIPLIVLDVSAVWVLLVSLPALCIYAAAVIRLAPGKKLSALGMILLNGTLGSMLLALIFPWAWIWLFAPLLLLKYGAIQEQNHKVSRWLEIHHLAAGDPHSWSRE